MKRIMVSAIIVTLAGFLIWGTPRDSHAQRRNWWGFITHKGVPRQSPEVKNAERLKNDFFTWFDIKKVKGAAPSSEEIIFWIAKVSYSLSKRIARLEGKRSPAVVKAPERRQDGDLMKNIGKLDRRTKDLENRLNTLQREYDDRFRKLERKYARAARAVNIVIANPQLEISLRKLNGLLAEGDRSKIRAELKRIRNAQSFSRAVLIEARKVEKKIDSLPREKKRGMKEIEKLIDAVLDK